MRLTRIALTLAVAISVLVQPGVASASDDNPYWSSETNLPADTITGEWTVADDGGSVELTFSGNNLLGQNTRFVAGWTTPWVTHGSFSDEGRLDTFLSPTTSLSLHSMSRSRTRGDEWGRWFKHRLPYEEGLGMGGSGVWMGASFLASTGGSSKVQYQWKLIGEIDGLGEMDATIELVIE